MSNETDTSAAQCISEEEKITKITSEHVDMSSAKSENQNSNDGVKLSKNKMKKLLKQQRWEETKHIRRKREKEKQKLKKQLRREMVAKAESEGVVMEPKRKMMKMSDPDASQVKVAIDCSFDDLMSETDINKLTKQISRCYTVNRYSYSPFQFYLCNLGGPLRENIKKRISGYLNWDVHIKDSPLDQVFTKDEIVYLSSESPNILTELDPRKAYVIGGLVDHNHHKGLCYQGALSYGWSHAQLPIEEYVKLNSRTVLTVNHVFEILSAFLEKKSWKDAFYHVLPPRKVVEFLDGEKSASSLGEEDEGNSSDNKKTIRGCRTEEGEGVKGDGCQGNRTCEGDAGSKVNSLDGEETKNKKCLLDNNQHSKEIVNDSEENNEFCDKVNVLTEGRISGEGKEGNILVTEKEDGS